MGSNPGRRWNEERAQVVRPGGAVSASRVPPAAIRSSSTAAVPAALGGSKAASLGPWAFSATRPRAGQPDPPKRPSSARGQSVGSGSSRRSKGSSRPSSREDARDGDISSSRPSSGGWSDGALTGSSNNDPSTSRARSVPPDSRSLHMPDPIRKSPLFQELLGDNPLLENTEDTAEDDDVGQEDGKSGAVGAPGVGVRQDPYGRDAPRHGIVRCEWTVDRLVNYFQSKVMRKIDSGLQSDPNPKDDKLNNFVKRLIANIKRENSKAPKRIRPQLHGLFFEHFRRFWNFDRNEKVAPTSPEELSATLQAVIEALKDPDFQRRLDASMQMKGQTQVRSTSNRRMLTVSVLDDR